MSLDNCYRAYGRCLVTFNRLAPLLETAIVREAGMEASAGAILLGPLGVKARLAALRALLTAAGSEKADAGPLLAELAQDAKKQPLLQGQAQVGGTNSLLFTRPGGALAEYTGEEMETLADQLAGRIDALGRALGIGPAQLAAQRRAAEEAAARRRRAAAEDEAE